MVHSCSIRNGEPFKKPEQCCTDSADHSGSQTKDKWPEGVYTQQTSSSVTRRFCQLTVSKRGKPCQCTLDRYQLSHFTTSLLRYTGIALWDSLSNNVFETIQSCFSFLSFFFFFYGRFLLLLLLLLFLWKISSSFFMVDFFFFFFSFFLFLWKISSSSFFFSFFFFFSFLFVNRKISTCVDSLSFGDPVLSQTPKHVRAEQQNGSGTSLATISSQIDLRCLSFLFFTRKMF